MRAVVVSEFGGPERLRLEHVGDPVAGPGQVRVAVHAAGVNPVDAGNRADGRWAGLDVPCVLRYDVAGIIDSAGPRTCLSMSTLGRDRPCSHPPVASRGSQPAGG